MPHSQLAQLGFDFRTNQQLKKQDPWTEKLNDLIDYKAANEGNDPPSSLDPLGPWSAVQRYNYRSGLMQQDKITRLNEIGFDFFAEDDGPKHQKEASAKDSHNTGVQDRRSSILSASVQNDILQAISTWKPMNPPLAASEVAFDINHPPKIQCDSSKLCTLDMSAQLNKHDICIPQKKGQPDFSYVGNKAYWRLLHDFQPFYLYASSINRRSIATSVVLIVHKRGGKFYCKNELDGQYHECNAEEAVNSTGNFLRRSLNATEIRREIKRLTEMYIQREEASDVQREEKQQSLEPEERITGDTYAWTNESEAAYEPSNDAVDDTMNTAEQSVTPGQESTYWEYNYHALNAYIQRHGQPPQTREDNPLVYDWLQLQKERQNQIESLVNFC